MLMTPSHEVGLWLPQRGLSFWERPEDHPLIWPISYWSPANAGRNGDAQAAPPSRVRGSFSNSPARASHFHALDALRRSNCIDLGALSPHEVESAKVGTFRRGAGRRSSLTGMSKAVDAA